jgi:hypothetical protein
MIKATDPRYAKTRLVADDVIELPPYRNKLSRLCDKVQLSGTDRNL